MEIIVGKNAGFCYGVKRAVEECEKQANSNSRIYCLGEIVHNKQVVEELEKQGIEFIETIDEVKEKNTILIIRAHGVPKEVYLLAKERNIELIDCTCPNVLKIHKITDEYQKQGYYIFLIGKEEHPEIVGIKSCCGENYSIIENEDDINVAMDKFKESNIKKLLLICQTTYNTKKFENIKNIVNGSIPEDVELIIKNTICLATEIRQKESKELSQNVDAMIIVGGKNSSNTKKLFEIALENCKNTICIETKAEIDKNKFKDVEKVGIMAGASTPQKSIEEIVKYLN